MSLVAELLFLSAIKLQRSKSLYELQENDMKRVVLYSMSLCPHCETAQKYLLQQNIKFRLVNVKTPAGQKELQKAGYRAVPVLKVGDQFLNGFSIKQFNKLYQQ